MKYLITTWLVLLGFIQVYSQQYEPSFSYKKIIDSNYIHYVSLSRDSVITRHIRMNIHTDTFTVMHINGGYKTLRLWYQAVGHVDSITGPLFRFSNHDCKGRYMDDRLYEIIEYKNGIKHGKYTRFHENGQKAAEGNYTHGKKDGIFYQWSITGTLQMMEYYKHGASYGPTIEYNDSTHLTEFINVYYNDRFEGPDSWYRDEGFLLDIDDAELWFPKAVLDSIPAYEYYRESRPPRTKPFYPHGH